MKKILLILLSIFALKLTALGVNINCWEEYSTLEAQPAKSEMRKAVENAGGTVVYLHTRALTLINSSVQAHLYNDGTVWDNYGKDVAERAIRSDVFADSSIYDNLADNTTGTIARIFAYSNRTVGGNYGYSDRKTRVKIGAVSGATTNKDHEYYTTHFVHTYCAVDSSSSNGSNGSASVNFIIKAKNN